MHQTINSRKFLKGKKYKEQIAQTLKEELELICPDFSKQNVLQNSFSFLKINLSLFLDFLPFILCKSGIINSTKYL